MRIGIIVYSQTGHTRTVATRLAERLSAAGHEPELVEVRVNEGHKPGKEDFTIVAAPDPARYEALVFAASVEAFSLVKVMRTYLGGIGPLEGRSFACLVTQHFPFAWMGGNRALRQLRAFCENRGGRHLGGAVVNWAGAARRERTSAAAVERLAARF